MRPFAIVVAADAARGIGQAGGLPWRLPKDMAYFKRITSHAPAGKQNAVIMGRKTYESIPAKFRPLSERQNIVLSRNESAACEGATMASSLDAALALLEPRDDIHQVFVIGGGNVYRQALQHPLCQRVFLTRVHATLACDTFLSPFEANFARVSVDGPHLDNGLSYSFELYERAR